MKSEALTRLCVHSRWTLESRALSTDWAMGVDSGGHDWEGAPYSDAYVLAFQQRMEEVGGTGRQGLNATRERIGGWFSSCSLSVSPWPLQVPQALSHRRDSG